MVYSYLQRYFTMVTAMTEAGNTTARSDGLTVVIENDVHDFQILDGLGCSPDEQVKGAISFLALHKFIYVVAN